MDERCVPTAVPRKDANARAGRESKRSPRMWWQARAGRSFLGTRFDCEPLSAILAGYDGVASLSIIQEQEGAVQAHLCMWEELSVRLRAAKIRHSRSLGLIVALLS